MKAAYKALKHIYVDFAVAYGKSDRKKKAAESDRAYRAALAAKEVKVEPPHKKARNEDPCEVSSGVVFGSGGDICADVSDSDAVSESDKEEDDGGVRVVTEDELEEADRLSAAGEFKGKFKNWQKYCKEDLDFKKIFPDANLPEQLDVVTHLLKLDVGIIYRDITDKIDQKMLRFGFIPLLASCSVGEVGAVNAESFCERVLSVCNTAMTDGNTLLSDEELEWLVVLRINSGFMEFMRENYLSEIIKTQPFNMTVVDVTQTQDCTESEEEGG